MKDAKKKKNWLAKGSDMIGKYEKWFVLFTFLALVVIPIGYKVCNFLFVDKYKIIYSFVNEAGWIYIKNPGDEYHINSIQILFNDSISSKVIDLDLREYNFIFGNEIDSIIDTLRVKSGCKTITFPILINTEYVLKNKTIYDQSEYIVSQTGDGNNRYRISYFCKKSKAFKPKAKLSYLYKCAE